MLAHFILYVRDQERSRRFYAAVLGEEPTLDVPGMTEFRLSEEAILGLMPNAGIKRLLGDRIADPAEAGTIPRAELYLKVHAPQMYLQRALGAGALELSPVARRDWGDLAGYCSDLDGHVIAFARSLE